MMWRYGFLVTFALKNNVEPNYVIDLHYSFAIYSAVAGIQRLSKEG